MGLFSFGKKNDDTPTRRGANTRSSRVEPRRRRAERSGEASVKDTAYAADAMLLDPTLPEKQRARRRLVGAIALVIAAVVVLPLVLDSHPKPVTDDIAIDIPNQAVSVPARAGNDVADVAPTTDLQAGVEPDNAGMAAAGVTQLESSTADTGATDQSAIARTQPAKPARSASSEKPAGAPHQPAAPTVLQAPSSPATNPQAQQQAAKPATARASSAANGDSGTPTTPAGARFAVQLGMFADDASARQWASKLRAAGVPAYIERRKQADGTTRTLLRAGPFPDRAAASAAITKVRAAGLTANAAQ